MLDFRHLPPSGLIDPVANWRVFTPGYSAGTVTDSWQAWTKPRGCSFVYGLVMGAGGGGGSPNTGAVSGAGGGGPGRVATFMCPAAYLPDTLYVRPGVGGAGAAVINTNGATGDTSYIVTSPVNNPSTAFEAVLLTAIGGGGGNASVTAGTQATATVFSNQLQFAVTSDVVGASAASGGTSGNVGGNSTWGVSGTAPICGGSGGGGGNTAKNGGRVLATGGAGVAPFDNMTASAGNGLPGFGYNRPINQLGPRGPSFFAFTGGGGGGAAVVTGGNGGPGAYGCGGGGGGGGGTTQGNGGNGGDSVMLLMAW